MAKVLKLRSVHKVTKAMDMDIEYNRKSNRQVIESELAEIETESRTFGGDTGIDADYYESTGLHHEISEN